MNNQETREQSQKVKFSPSDEKEVEQTVSFDPSDEEGWLVISQSGNEISLSLENWRKLQELAERVIAGKSEGN